MSARANARSRNQAGGVRDDMPRNKDSAAKTCFRVCVLFKDGRFKGDKVTLVEELIW